MDVQRVAANNKLTENAGKVALQRGPLMYCAEWADNNGRAANLILPAQASFTCSWAPAMLNGVMLLKSSANALQINGSNVQTVTQPFVAIPYYAWANRGKGEMMLWLPEQIADVQIITQQTLANSQPK